MDDPSVEIPTEEFLKHFGVRGMKWGVRRAEKKAAKADVKWQKNIYSINGGMAIHNRVADKMNNGGLDKLNSQPKYKNNKFDDYFNPLNQSARDYINEYNTMTERFTKEAVTEVHGTSPSGKLKARLGELDGHTAVIVEKVDISHADVEFETLKIILDVDEHGIIGGHMVKDELSQSDIDISMEDFLEHFGVKGMKWGVRKGTTESKTTRRSEDHIRSRELKRKPVSSLSNADLRFLNERLNLEQSASRLNPNTIKKGRNTAKEIVATIGAVASVVGLVKSPMGKRAIEMGKKVVWNDRFNNIASFP